MKTVSQLDANGFFVGTTEADESPLEPGEYLIPGGCIDEPAPTIPEGHRARWAEGWVFEEIHVPEVLPEAAAAPLGATQQVTMRQARLALLDAGLLGDVLPAIDALPEPDRSVAKIEWEYSSHVHRHQAFVQSIGVALGLGGDQLDELFVKAAAL